uniref:Uncharacterized protein n=1 Tax=Anguilla anguilla TaxID=7936 RepID=A0A0E9VLV9_ANGAN
MISVLDQLFCNQIDHQSIVKSVGIECKGSCK